MSENPRLHWTSPLRYSQPYPSDAPDTLLTREVRWGAGDLTPGTCRAETQYSRTARLTQRGDYLKGAAPAVSNPLMVRKTYFSMGPPVGTESEGDTRLLSAKEGTPPPSPTTTTYRPCAPFRGTHRASCPALPTRPLC